MTRLWLSCLTLTKSIRDLQSDRHYSLCKGMLVRTWCNRMQPSDAPIIQNCCAYRLSQQLTSVAHDQISLGQLGIRKTLDRLQRWLYWLAVNSDVKKYVHSCEFCQRLSKCGVRVKAPLINLPRSRVAMDVVGPLTELATDFW